MSELDRDILRWVLLIGTFPIWWPFLRTLWRDFNRALRDEGGLFGRPPSAREREQLERERALEPDTLYSEPLVGRHERRRTRLGARASQSRVSPGPGSTRAKSARFR